jgi:GxxExxY protein
VFYEEVKMDIGFRSDLIVENSVIVEIKSIETIASVRPKILLTYLKLTGITVGLLINFNEPVLKKRNQKNSKQLCTCAPRLSEKLKIFDYE